MVVQELARIYNVYFFLVITAFAGYMITNSVIRQSSWSPKHTIASRNLSRIECRTTGTLVERVRGFNSLLASVREEKLRQVSGSGWRSPVTRPQVVYTANDVHLEQLLSYPHVTTVVLPWIRSSSNSSRRSPTDSSNLLLHDYYEWTADDTLCSWIETGKVGPHSQNRYSAAQRIYQRTCNRNFKDTARPIPLRTEFANEKPFIRHIPGVKIYPPNFIRKTPPFLFYVHIHRDAIVTDVGDVISGNLKLIVSSCQVSVTRTLPARLSHSPIYDEVFVISQVFDGFYHRTIEIVPKLALCLVFLKAHPEIRILGPRHQGRLAQYLEILGVNASRLMRGAARARIAYQPRAAGCAYPDLQQTQTLSRVYRDYIRRTFPAQPRNRLILIRRSTTRKFRRHTEIAKALRSVAKDYNLTYELFNDNPVPSLNDTMIMFHSAVMIVAPCGAGESNIIFSQPGTYVIEGVCGTRRVILCFLRLAHVLGHHWHGLTSRGGCDDGIDVSASDIETVARTFLRLWVSE